MASDAPLRSARLPSPQQVTELLERDFAQAGYDIEGVDVTATTSPPRIVIIADGDVAPDLDAIAVLSRIASERLDAAEGADPYGPYVLEVTSPGVERPLTLERHFRRARGRKAEVTMSDGTRQTARLGEITEGAIRLVVAGARPGQFAVRDVLLADVIEAVVQVEFSQPNRKEVELAGGTTESGREADA